MKSHIPPLDGWRAISILLVLAAHTLPFGIAPHQANGYVGISGMALFFILSGYLITGFLLKEPPASTFILRRASRVLPLALVCIAIALGVEHASAPVWRDHLLFIANLPEQTLTPRTAHLWSLCIEVQFYICAFVLYGLLGKRALYLIPVSCALITAIRFATDSFGSSVTYLRADELLAGGVLAMALNSRRIGPVLMGVLAKCPWALLLVLFALACTPILEPAYILRPYIAAMLVGKSIVCHQKQPDRFTTLLSDSKLSYVATISYALYVIHPLLLHTWLGSGEPLEKYPKRIIFFFVLWGTAHLSTFYLEKPIVRAAKKLERRPKQVNIRAAQ